MKKATVSLERQLAQRERIAAPGEGMTVSKDLGEAARENIERDEQSADGKLQLEAIEKILAGPKSNLMENGRMPTADERNARR